MLHAFVAFPGIQPGTPSRITGAPPTGTAVGQGLAKQGVQGIGHDDEPRLGQRNPLLHLAPGKVADAQNASRAVQSEFLQPRVRPPHFDAVRHQIIFQPGMKAARQPGHDQLAQMPANDAVGAGRRPNRVPDEGRLAAVAGPPESQPLAGVAPQQSLGEFAVVQHDEAYLVAGSRPSRTVP